MSFYRINLLFIFLYSLTACNDDTNNLSTTNSYKSTVPTEQQEMAIDRQTNLVLKSLGLDSITESKFKPIYKKYRLEKFASNNKIGQLFGDKDPETMTDADYKDFIIESKQGRINSLDLEIKYIDQFDKVLSVRKVGQLFMIEQKMQERLLNIKREKTGQTGQGTSARPNSSSRPNQEIRKNQRQEKALERLKQNRAN